jgi:hypothetical protein
VAGGPKSRPVSLTFLAGVILFCAAWLPWASAVYPGYGRYGQNGFVLTYAHWPHFRAGLVPIVLGTAALWVAVIGSRRSAYIGLAVAPGAIGALFVAFFLASFHGHLGESFTMHGATAPHLEIGYWIMLGASVVLLVAGFNADRLDLRGPPPDVSGRVQATDTELSPATAEPALR